MRCWLQAYIAQAAISKIKTASSDPDSRGLNMEEFSCLVDPSFDAD